MDRAEKSLHGAEASVPEAGNHGVRAAQGPGGHVPDPACRVRSRRRTPWGSRVTDDEVDKRIEQLKKQFYGGSDSRYQKALKQQGLTEDQAEGGRRAQLVSEELFKKVTSNIKVSPTEVEGLLRLALSRSTASLRRVTCDTSSSRRRSSRTAFTRSSKSGGTSRRLRRSTRRIRLRLERRQADDLEGPDGPGVRQDRVRRSRPASCHSRSRRSTATTSSRRSPPSRPAQTTSLAQGRGVDQAAARAAAQERRR